MEEWFRAVQILTVILITISYLCSGQSPANLVNASPTDFVTDAFNKLPSGWIVDNVPSEMKVGDSKVIEVRIAKNLTDDLYKNLSSVRLASKIERIGTRMKPELYAENGSGIFSIDPQFSPEMANLPIIGNYTKWDWNVMPLTSGYQKIKLDVYATVEIPPYQPYYHPYPVFEKTIIVDVNPTYTAKSILAAHWEFLIGLIFTPIAGFVLKTFRKYF